MGEPDQEAQYPTSLPLAPFPAPPPFWKSFTSANLLRLKAIRAAQSPTDLEDLSTELEQSGLRSALPTSLLPLLPPPAPSSRSQQSYTIFSQPQPVDPLRPTGAATTTSQATTNLKPLLHTLTDTLLLLTLQLTTELSTDPSSFNGSTTAIEKTLDLIRDSLDRYRPAQARDDVVKMLERRIEEMKGEIGKVERWEQGVGAWLGDVEDAAARKGKVEVDSKEGDGDGGNAKARPDNRVALVRKEQNGNQKAKRAADKRMWESIWDIEGPKDVDMG